MLKAFISWLQYLYWSLRLALLPTPHYKKVHLVSYTPRVAGYTIGDEFYYLDLVTNSSLSFDTPAWLQACHDKEGRIYEDRAFDTVDDLYAYVKRSLRWDALGYRKILV